MCEGTVQISGTITASTARRHTSSGTPSHAVPNATITDFLPYKCAACGLWFCGSHRTPDAHACTATVDAAATAAASNAAAAAAAAAGSATGPPPPAKPKAATKCKAKGCKTALTMVNATTCSRCTASTCLRHRHPDDHGCKGTVAPILPSLHLVRHVEGVAAPPLPPRPYGHVYGNAGLPITNVGLTVMYAHPNDVAPSPTWQQDAVALLDDLCALHAASFRVGGAGGGVPLSRLRYKLYGPVPLAHPSTYYQHPHQVRRCHTHVHIPHTHAQCVSVATSRPSWCGRACATP